ncbi:TPA: hypothetical protein PXA79_002186 [Mannheimia haemolytica]|nr:hypothetical protein [Mannheimia haemolytica]HDL5893200.1 hypothetical protein [Mannheimia haemolytica]
MFGKLFYKMNPKVLAKIGEDFRKAGFVGMVISNDQISTSEGFVLFLWGLYIWIIGHIALHHSEKILNSKQGEPK